MSTEQETDDGILKDATLLPIADSTIRYDQKQDSVVLVMGPTGAGKSRFIEVLARNDALEISRDQLDSVTQVITTYELTHMELWEGPGTSGRRHSADDGRVYILDTPGFSDSQISELEIIEMVKGWMKAQNKKPGSMTVITTMWDRLWNERTKAAAEERFTQLRDHVWKDLLEGGGNLTKFTNTHSSAIDCLNHKDDSFQAFPQSLWTASLRDETFSPHLYHDLLDRIQATQQRKNNIQVELSDPVTRANPELKAYMEEQLHKAEQLLTKFEGQLIAFGDPPVGFEEVIPFIQSIVKKHRQEEHVAVFRKAKNFLKAKLRGIGHKDRK
ncbi:hypothetical protein BJ165DRAFT_1595611 [Panaeolus papilionaceus]|nr:hypothetical protein BJ165DRAFT_1595611 [Panaeolus papilionaceus]